MKNNFMFLFLGLFLLAGCSSVAPGGVIVNDPLIVEDYKYAIALGQIEDSTTWNKWGYNDDVDASGIETIWAPGNGFTWINTSSKISFVSTSNSDNGTGTGARSVIIYGLNGTRYAILEVLALDGTTPVITVNNYTGINRVATYLVGDFQKNVGVVTGTSVLGSHTQAMIPASQGTTQQAIFFSQTDHTFLVDWLWIHANKVSGGGSPVVEVRGYVKSFVSGSIYEVYRTKIDTSVENTEELRPSQPFVVGEKSILYFTADSDSANTGVNMRFSGAEVLNP